MKNLIYTLRRIWSSRKLAWRLILSRSLLTAFRYDGMSKFQTIIFDLRFIWVCGRSIA